MRLPDGAKDELPNCTAPIGGGSGGVGVGVGVEPGVGDGVDVGVEVLVWLISVDEFSGVL